jgi:hypothetical protein
MDNHEIVPAVPAVGDRWYRYDYQRCSPGVNEWGDALPGTMVQVKLSEFVVSKITPKGVWLQAVIGQYGCSDRRFVLLGARKKFALPTLELAMTSFRARKAKEISIYQRRIKIAQAALEICNSTRLSDYVFVP